jgi:hypothetical protein
MTRAAGWWCPVPGRILGALRAQEAADKVDDITNEQQPQARNDEIPPDLPPLPSSQDPAVFEKAVSYFADAIAANRILPLMLALAGSHVVASPAAAGVGGVDGLLGGLLGPEGLLGGLGV